MSAAAAIRPATAADAAVLALIYNYYITDTVVTFEELPVTATDMDARLAETGNQELPWLVAQTDAGVQGYAYASRWKGRCAYRHSVEVTVYVEREAIGRGLGTQLYSALFAELARSGCHVAIGGITLPNAASVALHEKAGMRKVAHFREVGYKFGGWLDVGYWQCVLPAAPSG
ncbi:MAG: arsinothricin resistance N-acetyltransferase ArsN1 family B [Steroidobacteraceae bacterium]